MPNTTPVSWLAEQAIEQRIALITIANGCRTNIGATISLEELQRDDEIDPPLAAISLDTETRTEKATGVRQRDCVFVVECAVPANMDNAQRLAHDAKEDVLDAFPSRHRFNLADGVTADVEITTARVVTRPDGAAVTIAQVELACRVLEYLP